MHYHSFGAMMIPEMALFPIMVKLEGRECVVVGAGKVATAKIKGLLSCGAMVTVVSPKAGYWIRAQASAGKMVWRRRQFSPHDLAGAFMVIAATDSPTTNAAVFRCCQARNVLCNSVDDPAHCDFFYPAVVRRGPLLIAISTSGRSPALAARLRRELARQFGPEWSAFVERVGERRQEILRTAPSAQRMRLLRQIAVPSGSAVPKRASKAIKTRTP
jgi:precorrin-2 dehydrogenase/sirohydrochlorin ferrochelatase